MNGDKLIIRASRAGSAMGAVLFGIGVYGFIDFQFVHYIPFTMRPGSTPSLIWGLGLAAAFCSFMICAKTALFPSVVFAANWRGVRLGHGIFRNVIVDFPWTDVADVREGAIMVLMSGQSALRSTAQPALEIVFQSTVKLPSAGSEDAHASGHSYLVAKNLIRRPISDVVSQLKAMQDAAVKLGNP